MTRNNPEKIIYSELSYVINGLCFKVQGELGRFCREKQYCDALERKLQEAGLNYKRESDVSNEYVDGNIADFVIDGKILLEAKSVPYITKKDYFQVQRYLHSAGLKLGLLVNFRSLYLKPKRIINAAL